MMKKYVLLIMFFIGLWNSIYSQEQYGINYSPVEYPLTPEASSLFKYSDIGLTDNTGVTNISIPIYTIEAYGGLKIPIQLNYATVGVKVNQNATRVGLGWDLIAGGEISHIVQDLPDRSTGFSLHKYIDLETFEPEKASCFVVESDCEFISNILGWENGFPAERSVARRDVKPDYYGYSFLNYSGKIYKDYNSGKWISIPQNNLKISDNLRIFTDDKGVEYHFTSEIVMNHSFCEPAPLSWAKLDHQQKSLTNTLKLKNIKFPDGEEVRFNYDKQITYTYISSISQEYREQHKDALCYSGVPSGGKLEECEVTTQVFENIITSIEYKNNKIEFKYSDEVPSNGITIRKDLKDEIALTKILVTNGENKKIKEYQLEYSYFEASSTPYDKYDDGIHTETGESFKHRLKLNKVSNIISKETYELDYYDEGKLPFRYSTSQDYMGYHNGAHNSTLIPTIIASNDLQIMGKGADRNPNRNYIKSFMLKRVYYPTKGWTQLEYDLDNYFTTKKTETIENKKEILESRNGEQIPLTKDKIFEITTRPKNIYFSFNHDIEEGEESGSGGIPIGGDFCQAWLEDSNGAILVEYSSTNQVENQISSKILPTGTYKLEMRKVGDKYCKMIMSYDIVEESEQTKEYDAAGIRLKQIENFDGKESFVKTFDYTNPNTNKSSGIFKSDPIFNKKDFKIDSQDRPIQCNYEIIYDNPIVSLGNKDIKYEYITERFVNGNDNVGKKIAHYDNVVTLVSTGRFSDIDFPENPTVDWSEHKLSKEYYYSNNNKLLKETHYRYEIDDQLNSDNQYSGSKFKQIPGFNFQLEGFTDGGPYLGYAPRWSYQYKFLIYTGWLKNKGQITKDYFYTDTGVLQNTITTQTDYQYDNPNHQQVTKTTVTNSKGEVIETSYQYPHDLPTAPYVDNLIAQNRIGIPLQTTVVKDGTTVSDELTEYETFGDLYLPKEVFSKKGGAVGKTTEDRKLTYDRYDAKGNVLQYHTEDGLTTSILWGYNGQYPIAKVEGAGYDEISSYANNINGLRRGLPNAMVTTYTYEPLVGVTSITDPSGQTQRFTYDEFNRLKRIKDDKGKVLKEYEYHYKNQQ